MRACLALALIFCATACRDAPVGHRLNSPLFVPSELPDCRPGADIFCGLEARGVLDLPHQGFERFYGAKLSLEKHPRSRVAYTRFFWDELEPAPGQLRFELLDAAIDAAVAEGQTFAFRVMPEESGSGLRRVPGWLADAAGGTWGTHAGGARYFSPNYDAPEFLEAVERTVAALGARYDVDPRIDHVDVGFVGDTGEWSYAVDGASLPSAESRQRILTAFSRAFVRTPVLMAIGGVDDGAAPLRDGLRLGMGWRADCWGDLRRGWNHHDAFYEQQLASAGAADAWRTHPVAVETCGEMELWDALGYDEAQVRWALRWALDHHVSLLNNKSRQVPAKWRPLIDEYLSFSGPHLFVREVTRTATTIRVELDNRGSTPPYRDWTVALRTGSGVLQSPSLAALTDTISLTFDLPATDGDVSLALLDEHGSPVALANEAAADGSLALFSR